MSKLRPWLIRILVLLALGGLLYWALRNAPLAEIAQTLAQLTFPQLTLLIALNALIFLLITMRWWLIVRADNARIPLLPLIGYRLAVFGLSYFTPGPQVGGEPLQITYLQKNYGLSVTRATAAVIVDKLLEFLANFLFLAIGMFAIAQSGMLARISPPGWIIFPLGMLLLWPAIHVALLYQRRHPFSALLNPIKKRFQRKSGPARFLHMIILSEHMAAIFCRRQPRALMSAIAVSLLSWAGMVLEYQIMLNFLNASLTPAQVLASLTAVRLSFLMPLPAGLGTLEASQVFAATAFGLPAALGISLSLLMRARDLLIGGLGLILAGTQR